MHSFTSKFIFAVSYFFLHLKSLSATPVKEIVKVIEVRQDQYENGDDDDGAIPNPLRDAFDYASFFQYNQPGGGPIWYTIKPTPAATLGTYLPFITGNPKPIVPAPFQSAQGSVFNVDHVLELQVIASFVQTNNPNTAIIPDASWNSLRFIVTVTSSAPRPLRTEIARQIGQFNNLGGIPQKPNGSKQAFFRAALGGYLVSSGLPKYCVNGNRNYLVDRRGGILVVIDNVGTALGAAGSGGAQGSVGQAIYNAWSSYATSVYDKATSILVGGV